MEGLAAAVECRRDAEHRVGVGATLLQDGSDGDDLGGRAGLEDIGDRAVAAVGLVGRTGVVGVEGGHGGQGEDVAGARVHDDDGAALRTRRHDFVGECALSDVLDVAIDGELHGAAGLRILHRLGGAGDRYAAHALEGAPAVDATEAVVHGVFDAGEATAGLTADEADDIGGDVTGGVDALEGALGVDPDQAELVDLAPLLGGDVLDDIGEAPLTGEPLDERAGRSADHRGDRLRGAERVGDEGLVDRDVTRLHRDRQGYAARIDDVTAIGEHLDGGGALVDCGGGECVTAEALQLEQSAGKDREDDEHEDEQEAGATPGVAQAQGCRLLRRGSPLLLRLWPLP